MIRKTHQGSAISSTMIFPQKAKIISGWMVREKSPGGIMNRSVRNRKTPHSSAIRSHQIMPHKWSVNLRLASGRAFVLSIPHHRER